MANDWKTDSLISFNNMQYDSHIKARIKLAKRVVARRKEWGIRQFRVRHAALFKTNNWSAIDTQLMVEAFEAIAIYSGASATGRSGWHDGWGNKYGAYSPFSGAPLLGQHKDIPSSVVHSIMCQMKEM